MHRYHHPLVVVYHSHLYHCPLAQAAAGCVLQQLCQRQQFPPFQLAPEPSSVHQDGFSHGSPYLQTQGEALELQRAAHWLLPHCLPLAWPYCARGACVLPLMQAGVMRHLRKHVSCHVSVTWWWHTFGVCYTEWACLDVCSRISILRCVAQNVKNATPRSRGMNTCHQVYQQAWHRKSATVGHCGRIALGARLLCRPCRRQSHQPAAAQAVLHAQPSAPPAKQA